MTVDLAHNPFAVAEKLAPVPATRDEATTEAWVRHHAATGLAAFTEFHRASLAGFGRREPGSRPDLGYLVGLGVAATHAAIALSEPAVTASGRLWDLTPEAGALNGEWEEWLADTLDRHDINPADINPAYATADFNSPSQTERVVGDV